MPDVLFDEPCLAEVVCLPLATFLAADPAETDRDDLAVDFVDFLAVVFFAEDLLLEAGVAAHTASAVLNARAITIAIERKRLVS